MVSGECTATRVSSLCKSGKEASATPQWQPTSNSSDLSHASRNAGFRSQAVIEFYL